jgi:hypothetical protein
MQYSIYSSYKVKNVFLSRLKCNSKDSVNLFKHFSVTNISFYVGFYTALHCSDIFLGNPMQFEMMIFINVN